MVWEQKWGWSKICNIASKVQLVVCTNLTLSCEAAERDFAHSSNDSLTFQMCWNGRTKGGCVPNWHGRKQHAWPNKIESRKWSGTRPQSQTPCVLRPWLSLVSQCIEHLSQLNRQSIWALQQKQNMSWCKKQLLMCFIQSTMLQRQSDVNRFLTSQWQPTSQCFQQQLQHSSAKQKLNFNLRCPFVDYFLWWTLTSLDNCQHTALEAAWNVKVCHLQSTCHCHLNLLSNVAHNSHKRDWTTQFHHEGWQRSRNQRLTQNRDRWKMGRTSIHKTSSFVDSWGMHRLSFFNQLLHSLAQKQLKSFPKLNCLSKGWWCNSLKTTHVDATGSLFFSCFLKAFGCPFDFRMTWWWGFQRGSCANNLLAPVVSKQHMLCSSRSSGCPAQSHKCPSETMLKCASAKVQQFFQMRCFRQKTALETVMGRNFLLLDRKIHTGCLWHWSAWWRMSHRVCHLTQGKEAVPGLHAWDADPSAGTWATTEAHLITSIAKRIAACDL